MISEPATTVPQFRHAQVSDMQALACMAYITASSTHLKIPVCQAQAVAAIVLETFLSDVNTPRQRTHLING